MADTIPQTYNEMLNCTLIPDAMNNIVANQSSMIRENIQLDLAISEPYSNTIKGNTINLNNKGETIRSLIANRITPAWSRVKPTFQRFTSSCNSVPTADQGGQTEYTTYMESLDGRGPSLCVRETVHTVLNSLKTIIESMKIAIGELKGYDIRYQYFLRSGLKFVSKTGLSFDTILTGGRKANSTSFYPALPNATPTLSTLIKIADQMDTVIGSERFGSGMDRHYLVITGSEFNERIRNDATVENAIIAQTQGGYADGNNSLKMYAWLDIQQRGLRFGVDRQPMRYNVLDAQGHPDLIEPEISVTSDYGVDSQPNPDWANAEYEIGFIVGKDGFEYLTPTSYTGEDKWKWAPQFTMGELVWHNVKDMGCNYKGDTGFHYYEMVRAINPMKPHAICAFSYKRCNLDLGLEVCTDSTLSS
jgi:hypothetical protein